MIRDSDADLRQHDFVINVQIDGVDLVAQHVTAVNLPAALRLAGVRPLDMWQVFPASLPNSDWHPDSTAELIARSRRA